MVNLSKNVGSQEPTYAEEEYEEYEQEPEPIPEVIDIPMDISEAEYTVHDGGIVIGMPALVIKTVGCNLHCTYCDVIKKKVDRGYNMNSMIQLLVGYADMDLIITGGEPFVQPDALGFLINVGLDARKEFGYTTNVVVETNGTIGPEILRRTKFEASRVSDDKLNSVVWSINPKLHSSHEEWSKTRFTDFMEFPNVQIRLTVNPFDPDDLSDMRRIASLTPSNVHIVAHPVVQDLESYDIEAYQRSLHELYKIVIDERLARVRIIPQLHKVIWGMRKESI
jgi:organic radical activating enzyme